MYLITWLLCEIVESLKKQTDLVSADQKVRNFFNSFFFLFIFCLIRRSTNEIGEVHVQSPAVAKVRVHPTAMQHHLGHTLLDHLVILRPAGSKTQSPAIRQAK